MSNKIHCAHILVEKLSVAQELRAKIAKGESFANLAKEYSIDVSKKRGGDLGFFGRGIMVPEFEKAAFALQKGQVSDVVKTQFGYHIIKRLD
ncbi:MAG: peptidylprolyl isomerase [Thaumarchaeota archaeon 13_1_40CM_4_38_7]|nr:MAG: peptidylprolyl isomerase [Thaumarchaeota archaeon 13_1_40CM_4_38_7]OLC92155.1 MAG: peptidylprolyl isomerase [Thaumarchaeota archaeon 13_1_40CM_3_38_6]OLD40658.1 MAG: peptidylprolyl isomerase [Thaumarchaeota archaeon 13_1_40CM_2_39_4]